MLSKLLLPLILSRYILVVAASESSECALWLAPSQTGSEKETRYGMFAGRAYKQNETLPLPDIAIPLVDMIEPYNRNTLLRDIILDFVESNMWTADYAGTKWEGNLSANVVIPGIGVLPQYHTGASNVDYLQQGVLLRDLPKSPKSGTPHPSRGAITPYYNVTLRASRDIPAGMELLADFGDVWDGNYTTDFYQDKITRHDYEIADEIIQQLVSLYKDFPSLSLDLKEDILDFVLDKVLGKAAKKHAKTIKSLIPENPRKLQKVLDKGGSFMYRYPDMIHSTEWLSKNGYCLDTIKMGPSTIPYAGRGAFATRSFAKEEIITLTPMMHIADKELLTMYKVKVFSDSETGEEFQDYDRAAGPIGQQLIMNYCFGHPESSLLLFPLGSHVGLINHDEKPNAYITWSRIKDNGLPNQHKYHDDTVQELAKVDKIVVVMKVVALREIAEDEEITIDYGKEWVDAWETYMKHWEAIVAKNPHPLKAEDVRARYHSKPLQTAETIAGEPYPPNVATACFLTTRERADGLSQREGSITMTEWDEPDDGDLYRGNRLFIVDILDRVETGDHFFYNYTVMARLSPTLVHKVLNVPHSACTFVNRPYTSDIFTADAFRHPIGIRDHDFPQAWRDLR